MSPSADFNLRSCFVTISSQDMVVHCVAMVSCGHMFCGECLASWLANKKDCPTCRWVGHAQQNAAKSLTAVHAQGGHLHGLSCSPIYCYYVAAQDMLC